MKENNGLKTILYKMGKLRYKMVRQYESSCTMTEPAGVSAEALLLLVV